MQHLMFYFFMSMIKFTNTEVQCLQMLANLECMQTKTGVTCSVLQRVSVRSIRTSHGQGEA